MLHTHSPLIISALTETWYFAAVAVLNMYTVHDLYDLDAYTLCTVHEQDLMVASYEAKNYMHPIVLVLYST